MTMLCFSKDNEKHNLHNTSTFYTMALNMLTLPTWSFYYERISIILKMSKSFANRSVPLLSWNFRNVSHFVVKMALKNQVKPNVQALQKVSLKDLGVTCQVTPVRYFLQLLFSWCLIYCKRHPPLFDTRDHVFSVVAEVLDWLADSRIVLVFRSTQYLLGTVIPQTSLFN